MRNRRSMNDINSTYGKGARFDGSAVALTEEQLFKQAPSIFATDAHSSRSERFAPIATIEVLRGLAKEGFSAVGVIESRARDADKQSHTKHLIRLRRLDMAKQHRVGDSVVEMLLKNANDGSAAYSLMAGLFRICCLNSLVAQRDTIEDIRVRHSGNVQQNVIDATYTVLERAEKVIAAPVDWARISLSPDDREVFAEAVHLLRFPRDENGKTTTAIKPEQFLIPRRVEDQSHDLWTVMNTIQENALKGGIEGTYQRANGRGIGHRTMRAVTGIDQSINLNKAIWAMGEQLAEELA